GMLLGAVLEPPEEDEPELIPLINKMAALREEAEEWARQSVGAGPAMAAAAQTALAELDRRMVDVQDRIADVRRQVFAWDFMSGDDPPDWESLIEQWESWPIGRKQAILRDLFEKIVVPGGREPVRYKPGRRAPKHIMVPID